MAHSRIHTHGLSEICARINMGDSLTSSETDGKMMMDCNWRFESPMCNLLARCLLRDWRSEIRIADVQSPKSLSMLSPKRLGIRIADVQSLSTLCPKRLGVRIANVQSLSALSPKRLGIGDSNLQCTIS